MRGLIWVALVKDGTALGAFVRGRTEAGPFTEQQLALLQNFARAGGDRDRERAADR
jgi:hypothetical protein